MVLNHETVIYVVYEDGTYTNSDFGSLFTQKGEHRIRCFTTMEEARDYSEKLKKIIEITSKLSLMKLVEIDSWLKDIQEGFDKVYGRG